jgi:hypothetical protein
MKVPSFNVKSVFTLAFWKAGLKSLAAAVAVAVSNVVMTTLVNPAPGVHLPNTTSEWVALAVTTVGGGAWVWFQKNYPIVADAAAALKAARKPATPSAPPAAPNKPTS